MTDLDTALGRYSSNAFCITLSEHINLFKGVDEEEFQVIIEKTDRAKFAVFLHEYWHYLINVSTFTRYHSFSMTFHIIALFSSTLMDKGNGRSSGNESLPENQLGLLKSIIQMYNVYDGHKRLPVRGKVSDFKIVKLNKKKSKDQN